jgi:hypothetical protein
MASVDRHGPDHRRSRAYSTVARAPDGVESRNPHASRHSQKRLATCHWQHPSTDVTCIVRRAAPDRDTVDTFYREALRLGGRDAGPPGPRPEYSGDNYGAFVFDLDGNKIEAVINSR